MPPQLHYTVPNWKEITAGLKKWEARAIRALGRSLYEEAEVTMTHAKRNTPVLTGALRASGHVLPPTYSLHDVTVTLGFGGPAGSGNQGGETNKTDVGYAIIVHENLSARHVVGGAKYLERAIVEAQGRLPRSLPRRAQTILREQNLA